MKETKRIGYHTDEAMRLTWLLLCDDLGTSECQPIRAAIARGDIRSARELCTATRIPYGDSPSVFKRTAQILSWAKRYRFANDMFTDDQLSRVSWKNYSDTQIRCMKPIPVDKFYRSGLIARWRRICASILGEYTESEHFERCAFAKNACLGHPAKYKGLDQKLKGPITGSMEHYRFLQRYAETDPTLADMLNNIPFHPASSLRLTFVPKSYKALRAIMPDTLAGSFYSSGIGEMIKSRLKCHGLNIDTLQRRHRFLAMKSSRVSGWRNCGHSPALRSATVDLSSASDSITTQLLSMILPRKWFHAIMRGRVAYYEYSGSTYRLVSACTMGLGHTFPLETLVFYVLTKGVAEWYGPNAARSVSVYGDDIIVPTEVLLGDGKYPPLIDLFRLLHLQINPDKSFWGWCDFRESCGGDFYRGHDVRPASPQGAGTYLSSLSYVAFLYKLANSLLKRWPKYCIENTLAWITLEIYSTSGVVLAVPPSFPDTSGLKVDPGEFGTQEPETINFGSYVVEFIQIELPYRRVFYERPLMWDGMRVKSYSDPRPWSISSYEAPISLQVRRRKVRTGLRYRTITYLVVPDAARAGRPRLAKSVCPQWT